MNTSYIQCSSKAKAFDKKTSVLHYLVKLMKQNDGSLLNVRDDLINIKAAELAVLDSLYGDFKALKDEIEPIRLTVQAQAEKLEKAGLLVQMSLKELTEQKTSVRSIDSVPQYNKIDHHTGRTPMERFSISAEARIIEALSYAGKVKEKFAKLLEYFGEDGSMASNDFFGTMNTFLGDFTKAVEHVNNEDKMKVCAGRRLDPPIWNIAKKLHLCHISQHSFTSAGKGESKTC